MSHDLERTVIPPSIVGAVPVTQEDSSDAR